MLAIFMVFMGAIMRLIPHLPNFTPINGLALFGGAKINKRYAILIPLLAVILSDYLLLYINPFNTPMVNFSGVHPITDMFHSTTLYVWSSVLISGLIGIFLKKTNRKIYIVGAAFLASIQFFLITNFGVWAAGFYGPGFKGLMDSYVAGIPFFRWTLLGDLFYTGFFFISYALVQNRAALFANKDS